MANLYTASYHNVAVTVAQDLMELTAPSDSVLKLVSMHVGQYQDAGDAEAESLRLNIVRYTTGGSGGAAADIAPHHKGQAASGVTADRNNTTPGGTPTIIHSSDWNVQVGWDWNLVPEEGVYVSPSGIIAINLPAAPADQLGVSVSMTWEELGG